MNSNPQHEKILKLLSEKSSMKQDVFANTIAVFNDFKDVLKTNADELSGKINAVDKRVSVNYKDLNQQSMQLKVAGDMLEFYMHTNVFDFDSSHYMFKTGYVRNNPLNSYCGIINVYNFLADSFKYNRLNDLGYLIARVFINREKHFFIESRSGLNQKYFNFSESPITGDDINNIVNELIVFAISFDLYTPPIDAVRSVTLSEIQEKANSNALRTGKRLGYSGSYSGANNNFDDDINL
ncbi:MAG: hypothetical protein JSU07_04340 [Bacteroidetes bacterium]|nr:hypothetical protein [Bacteroidota bacterium]